MRRKVLHHVVKNGKHFTQSAGLLMTCPVAEALKDECFLSAWLLRYEAFLRFGYDPDAVFTEKTGECGFRGQRRTEIPGVNLLDLRVRIVIFLD